MYLVDKILSQQKTDWLKEDTSNDENQQKKVIFLKIQWVATNGSQKERKKKNKQKLQIIWIGNYKQRGQK